MADTRWARDWPPADGREFVKSDDFGAIVVHEAVKYAERYPKLDFTDGAAQVFTWFSHKLAKNRRFINKRRFPTADSFIAYIRHAIWNASRMSERTRQRRQQIAALPVERPIAAEHLSAKDLER